MPSPGASKLCNLYVPGLKNLTKFVVLSFSSKIMRLAGAACFFIRDRRRESCRDRYLGNSSCTIFSLIMHGLRQDHFVIHKIREPIGTFKHANNSNADTGYPLPAVCN